MAWCPNCKQEYREGYIKCSDCGADLVDELPQDNTDQFTANPNILIDPCLLISVSDKIQGGLVAGLLHDSGIPFFSKDKESGGYMKVYMGFSVYGTDIYVDKSEYDRAKELIDAYLSKSDIDNEPENEPSDDTNDLSFYRRKNVMRIIIFIIILSFALEFVIGGVSMFINFFGH